MRVFSVCVATAFVAGLVTGQLVDLSATEDRTFTVLLGPAEGWSGNDWAYGMLETNNLRYGMLEDAQIWGVIRVDSEGVIRIAVNKDHEPDFARIPGSLHELVYYVHQRGMRVGAYKHFVEKRRSEPVVAPYPDDYVVAQH